MPNFSASDVPPPTSDAHGPASLTNVATGAWQNLTRGSAPDASRLSGSENVDPATSPGERERHGWMDAARGIGIVLVVAGHVGSGLTDARIAQGALWPWLDYALYSFHMPVFFLLAGMNVPRSLRRGRSSFVRSKLWNLGYPYVLWSLIQGAILVELSRFTNTQMHWSDLLEIGWKPIAQYWFLYALLLSQLGAMLLASRPGWAVIAFLGALAATQLPLSVTGERFVQAFAFVLAGMLLSERLLQWRPRRPLLLGGVASVALLLSLPLTGQLSGMNYYAAIAWPSTILGVSAVMSLAQVPGRWQDAWAALGRASKTVYVLHLFVAAGLRIAIVKLHLAVPADALLVIATLAGTAAPFAAHVILRRLDLLWPLGLGPIPPRGTTRARAVSDTSARG